MSTYSRPESARQRELLAVAPEVRAEKRLELDLADILIGPTSGARAAHLASCAVSNDPEALARALVTMGTRYLNAKGMVP